MQCYQHPQDQEHSELEDELEICSCSSKALQSVKISDKSRKGPEEVSPRVGSE